MTDHSQDGDDFFFGIMVLKDGKWTPHIKYGVAAFGSAQVKAEELDKAPDFDGVKLMKIPTKGSAAQQRSEAKEIWVSPRLRARSLTQSAVQIRTGVKQTKEQLAALHAEEKAARAAGHGPKGSGRKG